MEVTKNVSNEISKLCISSPGKVILHGEHSVVYGHLAVAASLNLRTKVDFELVHNANVDHQFAHIVMSNLNLDISLPSRFIDQLATVALEGSWDFNHPENVNFENLVDSIQTCMTTEQKFKILTQDQKQAIKCCLFFMVAILHGPPKNNLRRLKPFLLKVTSELPVGAGAGSSASFCVSLAAVFVCIASFWSDSQKPLGLDEKTKDLISSWAFLGERINHGNPSGLDNSICTYGSLIAFRRPKDIKKVPLNNSLRVLLVDTKVSRNTSVLVDSVAKLRARHEDIVKAIMEAMDCISSEAVELLQLLDRAQLSQTTEETKNVLLRMEELWSMNHSLLTALGVSHPTLEHIIQISREHNLRGKLTGAGGGGFAIVLLPVFPTQSETALESLKEAFISCGFDVKDVGLGGPGVMLHL